MRGFFEERDFLKKKRTPISWPVGQLELGREASAAEERKELFGRKTDKTFRGKDLFLQEIGGFLKHEEGETQSKEWKFFFYGESLRG